MKTLHLTINFSGKAITSNRIDNPLVIPNIGDNIHNADEGGIYFIVTSKEIYYTASMSHVIVTATAQYLIRQQAIID